MYLLWHNIQIFFFSIGISSQEFIFIQQEKTIIKKIEDIIIIIIINIIIRVQVGLSVRQSKPPPLIRENK